MSQTSKETAKNTIRHSNGRPLTFNHCGLSFVIDKHWINWVPTDWHAGHITVQCFHHRNLLWMSTVNLHLKMISKEASANLICKYLKWIVRGIVRRTQLLRRKCQCDPHRRGGRAGGGPHVRPFLTNFNIDYLICETRVMKLCSLFLFSFSFSGELCGWEETQETRQALNKQLKFWIDFVM